MHSTTVPSVETVSRAQTLPRRRELCVGGSAAAPQTTERVAQVVGAADDAGFERGYAALVDGAPVPVGLAEHPGGRVRAVALERLGQVGAVDLPRDGLARVEGLEGPHHHLAQAHAHEPGSLGGGAAQLGAAARRGARQHVGRVVELDLGLELGVAQQ